MSLESGCQLIPTTTTVVLENGVGSRFGFQALESKHCDAGKRTGYKWGRDSVENLVPGWLNYIDLSPGLLVK